MSRGINHSNEHQGTPERTTKEEFAANLRAAMAVKGWTQSDLARHTAKHIKDGKFGRYSVSTYLSATRLPRAQHLDAMAKALDLTPTDLMPARYPLHQKAIGPSPVSIKSMGNGLAELQIRQETTWEMALSVARMLESHKSPDEITLHLSALKHSVPKFNLLDRPEKGSYALEISAIVTVKTESQELLSEAIATRDNFYADFRQLINKYGVISEGN